jgi:exodeoxyribonuclease VII small subunit
MVSEEIKDTKSPRFEEALSRLENILEAMESGEVPLDELVDKYEEGVSLLKTCNARLREAELKIEAVRKTNETIETEPFETDDS